MFIGLNPLPLNISTVDYLIMHTVCPPAKFHDISMHYEHIFWLAETGLVPPAPHAI